MRKRYIASKRALIILYVLFTIVFITGVNAIFKPPHLRVIATCPPSAFFAEIAHTLEKCMEDLSTISDVFNFLDVWKVVHNKADVQELDLTGDARPERVVIVYPDPTRLWPNPQGQLLIFQQHGSAWKTIFRGESIQFDSKPGEDWKNWVYEVRRTSDFTGDSKTDIMLKMSYSNGTHAMWDYTLILTGHSSIDKYGIYVAFNEETTRTEAKYSLKDTVMHSIYYMGEMKRYRVDRRFVFEKGHFRLVTEEIEPPHDAIQLLQDVSSNLFDQVIHRRAYITLLQTPPLTFEEPRHMDELVLLDIVNLKLIQLALIDGDVCYLHVGTTSACPLGRRSYAGVSRTYHINISSALGAIFEKAWQATRNASLACRAMLDTLRTDKELQHIRNTLRDIALRLEITLTPNDLCLKFDEF